MNRRSVFAPVALSVALAAGMCPVAYAQDADGALGQQEGALVLEPLEGEQAPGALHAHRVYTVPMSLMRADDPESASEAARYFNATAEVRLVDGKYSVRVSPTEAGDQFIAGISYGSEGTAAKVVSGRNVVPHVYELLFDELAGEASIGFTLVIPGMGQTQRKAVLKLDLDKLTPAALELDAGTAYVMPVTWQQPGGAPSHAGRAFDTFAEVRFADGVYDVRVTATASMDPLIQGLTYGTDAVAAQVTSADGVSPRQFQLKAATLDEPLKVGFSYATPDGSYHSQSAELVIDTTQISLAADKSGLESLLASARALKQGEKSDDAFAALTAAIAEAQATASNVEATQDEVDSARTALAAAVERFVGSLDQGALYVAPISWQQEMGSPSHAGRSFDGFVEVRDRDRKSVV